MSIPKEPRQLMINLMYLVLTALLALNVSAEVLHAFFTMDKSLGESNRLADGTNQQLAAAIGEQATAYSQFEPYRKKSKQAQAVSKVFFDYVGQLKEEILKSAGGIGKDGMPVRKADKDIPTRLFVKQGKGEELRKKALETREQLLALVDEPEVRQLIANSIPLKISELPEGSDKKNWAQFTFQQMPVAAVMPILTKFQNDVKVAEATILNHFAAKMDVETERPDQFAPVISTEKSYVIRGEEFRGEIFLAAYSSTADNLAISVDGRALSVRDGKAVFAANPNSIGTKMHEMLIRLTNPLTGQTKTFKKQFSYEVGERSVTASADKMNVFYLGVENPVSISAAGVPSSQVKVSADGVSLTPLGNGKFIAKPQKAGKAMLTVSGGGMAPATFEYRVKRIPDPVIYLGKSKGGAMPVAEFKAHEGLIPLLENFDFNAKAEVRGFELVRLRKGDAATAENRGGKYGSEARRLVDGAQRGDVFYFDGIKVHCPGDDFDRKMGSMVFTMK